MSKFLYSLLFLFIVHFPASGQKITPTPGDLYADATEFMLSGDYYDALLILQSLYERGFKSPNISYRIGECYLNIPGQKVNAIPYLKEAVKSISVSYTGNSIDEENAPAKAMLYLGIAYRLNYDFDNALSCFNNYKMGFDYSDNENIRLAEYHMERCHFARELMASPSVFSADTVMNMINSSSAFNPLVTSDESRMFYIEQMKFYDAIMLVAKGDAGWANPENLTPLLQSDGDHYITGISDDANGLFLTSYDPYRSGELFSSEYSKGQWKTMEKLNTNINTVFNESHASLSPDGKILYFTSDRKGGYGGLDIYKSVKTEEGDWGKPVNLGPLINTPYNEESPFVSADGRKLFFSSQGHYNMGGYDVFYASSDKDGNWLPPVNIGYPLNSTDDDLFWFPLDSGNIAYQSKYSASSQRDIIRYVVKSIGKPARFNVSGKIDFKSGPSFNPSNIDVAFIGKKENDTLAVKPLNEDGTFRQSLPAGSYRLDFSDDIETLLSRDIEIPEYFPHNNLVIHDEIEITPISNIDTLHIRDIRFEYNARVPDDSGKAYLEKLAEWFIRYPMLNLQVNGYTDARGSDQYNLKLSMQRAGNIKDMLIDYMVLPDRISVNAYGEKNPVAMNMGSNGKDNAEGRSYNRRVEIIIENVPETLVIVKTDDIPKALRIR